VTHSLKSPTRHAVSLPWLSYLYGSPTVRPVLQSLWFRTLGIWPDLQHWCIWGQRWTYQIL